MTTQIGHLTNDVGKVKVVLDDYLSKGIFKQKGDIDVTSNALFPSSIVGDLYKIFGDGYLGGRDGIYLKDDDLLLCISDSDGGLFEVVGNDFVVLRNNNILSLYDYKRGYNLDPITPEDSVNNAISKLENMINSHINKYASDTLGHFKGNDFFNIDKNGVVTVKGSLKIPGHPTTNDPSINENRGMVTVGFLNEYLKTFAVEYGVRRSLTSSTPTLERLIKYGSNITYGNDTGLVAGTSTKTIKGTNSFDNIYPWCNIVRCNMNNAGEITAYSGDPIYSETGSNGNVMVEIPVFYTKYQHNPNNDGYDYYWICDFKIDEKYYVNPLFNQNNHITKACYISAFSIYTDDNNKVLSIADRTVDAMTKKSDITTLITRIKSQYNNGFSLGSMAIMNLLFYLFIIEFATFNSQSKLLGIRASHPSGAVSGILGSSGSNTNPLTEEAFVYRGIESLWGNKGQVLQDIFPKQITGTTFDVYVSDNVSKYYDFSTMPIPGATAVANGYKTFGTSLTSNQDGFATEFLTDDIGFCNFPNGNTGSSTTYLCDYSSYDPSGLFVLGASISSQNNTGINGLTTTTISISTTFGARLQYVTEVAT